MLEAGTAVGRYVIQRKLAEGGMAEIYLATATGAEGFSKDVVIKVVRPFLASDAQFVQMFIAEARLVSRLDHANIVQIFDFGKHEDTYFLAMEYVRGASLWELRRRCRELGLPFPPVLGAEIAAQVARGLHFAHQLSDGTGRVGVVHRDVTPHNILLSFDGAVKLTDFGIAKATTSQTAPGMLKGKFAYMSPEQARGDAVDARTDVFALGIVTWELLTGGRLFDGDSDVAVLRAVQESLIAPPTRLNPDVPRELSDVVMKALSRRPEERFQTAGDLERALATFAIRSAQSVEDTSVALFLQELFRDDYQPGHPSRDLPGRSGTHDALGSADTLFLARGRARPQGGTVTHTPAGSTARQATPGPLTSNPRLPEELPSTTGVPALQGAPALEPARPATEMHPALRSPATRRPSSPGSGSGPRPAAPARDARPPSSPRLEPAAPPPARAASGSPLAEVPPGGPPAAAPRRPAWLAVVAILAGAGAIGGGAAMTMVGRRAAARLEAAPAAVTAPRPPEQAAPPAEAAPAAVAAVQPAEAPAPEPGLDGGAAADGGAASLAGLAADPGAPAALPVLKAPAAPPPPAPAGAGAPAAALPPAAAPAEPAPAASEAARAAAATRAPRPGVVKVLVRPFGYVAVNGGRHLEVSASRLLTLKPGRYEVELFDNHDASLKRVTLDVGPGDQLTVEAD